MAIDSLRGGVYDSRHARSARSLHHIGRADGVDIEHVGRARIEASNRRKVIHDLRPGEMICKVTAPHVDVAIINSFDAKPSALDISVKHPNLLPRVQERLRGV
jgi:hypothetical protein